MPSGSFYFNSLYKEKHMTNYKHLLDHYNTFSLGFDRILNDLSKVFDGITTPPAIANYPPFNLRQLDNTHYLIEMAVAGFAGCMMILSWAL